MLLLRIVVLLVAIAIGAFVVAYLASGERRYLGHAWRISKFALYLVFFILALMFLERALAPVAALV